MTQKSPIHVLHIIAGLGQGGAETILVELVAHTQGLVRHTTISLTNEGYYGKKMQSLDGHQLITLNIITPWNGLLSLFRLYRLLRMLQPDVVQTWMYYSDLIGGITAKLAGCRSIVWGTHNTINELPLRNRVAMTLCAWLSPWLPTAIICCSESAAEFHTGIGYPAKKIQTIFNGYDLSLYTPNQRERLRLRLSFSQQSPHFANFHLDKKIPVLGMVARWHPVKDHRTFFAALQHLKKNNISFLCILVGTDMTYDNTELTTLINTHDIMQETLLLGSRSDIPSIMNALDIHVLSSISEAFPNVVSEAMACGTPCVVTNVGDTSKIVSDTGWICEKSNANALAGCLKDAIFELYSEQWPERQASCRNRIREHFSLEKMGTGYTRLWNKLQ